MLALFQGNFGIPRLVHVNIPFYPVNRQLRFIPGSPDKIKFHNSSTGITTPHQ